MSGALCLRGGDQSRSPWSPLQARITTCTVRTSRAWAAVWPLLVAGTAALGGGVGTGIAVGDPDGGPGEVGFPGGAVPVAALGVGKGVVPQREGGASRWRRRPAPGRLA